MNISSVRDLSFEIADVKFQYIYEEELAINENAPIFNFKIESGNFNIINNISFNKDLDDAIYYKDYERIFDTPAWTLFEKDGLQVVVFHPNSVLVAITWMREGEKCFHTTVIDSHFDPHPLPICVTGFLLQRYLAKTRRGIIMHGATVIVGNTCFILTGNSGVGKSTLSSLLFKHAMCTRITDDRFILQREGQCLYSFGNPFDIKNERCLNSRAKIDKVMFLHHGKENLIRAIPKSYLISKMLKISLLPYWDKEYLFACIQLLQCFVDTVPCYDFYFTPDENAVQSILKACEIKE